VSQGNSETSETELGALWRTAGPEIRATAAWTRGLRGDLILAGDRRSLDPVPGFESRIVASWRW